MKLVLSFEVNNTTIYFFLLIHVSIFVYSLYLLPTNFYRTMALPNRLSNETTNDTVQGQSLYFVFIFGRARVVYNIQVVILKQFFSYF